MAKATREFSFQERADLWQNFSSQEYDLVVIGGGITGAGVARDASSRGMKVALVELQDFAQGTSSRSSKLIHGGIRYLENLEFGLVFEALSERSLLFDLAPHLVHPLRFVLPLYEGTRVSMFKMGLGMWLYDALSMFEAPEMHERLDHDETVDRIPLLQSKKLLGSYVYSDAYMDDDRLVIETLRSAYAQGADCMSYVKATGSKIENGKVTGVEVQDMVTQRKTVIRAKHVVSTVGAWTDIVAPQIVQNWKKILRPTKGVHLTFRRDRIPLSQAVVMASDDQKRIVFAIPRHEMVIIGTTDTEYSGDPINVETTDDDIKYLLKVASEYFPGALLQPKDIVASYCGVRPLVDDGAPTESKTSREHIIIEDPQNVTFVAGGKYTTYRLMAEQTVEAALATFTLEDQIRFRLSSTKVPLNPHATREKLDFIAANMDKIATETKLPKNIAEILFFRHGEEAFDIIQQYDLTSSTDSKELLWCLEARHAIHHTMCFHLTDFYVRRAPLFLSHVDHGMSLLPAISQVFAQVLGWGPAQLKEEIEKLKEHVSRELSWRGSLVRETSTSRAVPQVSSY